MGTHADSASPCTQHITAFETPKQTCKMVENRITSFSEFYPFYLTEHSKPTTKLLHAIGTTLAMLIFVFKLLPTGNLIYIIYGILVGYGFAWVSHFFVEKNKPASFKYPLYSFAADYVMCFEIYCGKHDVMP